uniref:Formylglycine-generating enzyme, required for sulfatase activity, contains SUMF1/FGE domain n=1 Tax=Candidatus Kentrum sp. FM TaxID=2126340 RepID=A0A450WEH6_9GAMM|nr:MAG: Formylglycine-generating enzyme, required for sulfatase activity, contains SUMF1/FGE domain [Candidatus Kentron sp. FM]VFJ48841.1 MAG: Formylglycine-generating enzyme, required for sulfatase activity, contains SUMF1/FGE domain [Candidatus Kentron sp. FM]VFK15415.1 MAG: Formylglycine-generating enzyme, required for sulfatase activity, contains SUMF1/FGE domain [Candidatus Kentron sp. FM]
MTKHALLIGVSEYTPDFKHLPAAVRDAAAFRALLRDPKLGGFAASHVTLLGNPARQEMEIAIESLFADRHRDDLVFLFFSGHGVKDYDDPLGRVYFAARDTRKTPNGRLRIATAVAAATIHGYMEDSRARRQVIVLDSCFSGAFPQGLSVKDDGKVDIRNQLGGEGRAVLTSSSALQYSYQQDDENLSLYTRFLIQGIETGEADADKDGIISAGEWHAYAKREVQAIRPAMAPEFYPGREGYAIHVARVPPTMTPTSDAHGPAVATSGDPGEAYRQEVAYLVHQGKGKISIVDRIVLDELRDEFGLDAAMAEIMEEQVLAPYRKAREEHRQRRQRYARLLRRLLEHQGGELDKTARATLGRQRERLELGEKDAEAIETGIREELARKREQEQQYGQALRELMQGKEFLLPDELRERLSRIRQGVDLPEEAIGRLHADMNKAPLEPGQPFRDRLKDGSLGPSMIVIPAGKFLMGSPEGEAGRFDQEGPQHEVIFANPFALGRGAVMVGEFRAFVEATDYRTQAEEGKGCFVWNRDEGKWERRKDCNWQSPGFQQDDHHPVVGITWNDAMEYVAWLREQTGENYRLPSEAEWEYAARAGTTTPFSTGECIHTDQANYDGSRDDYADCGASTGVWREKTVPVGSLPANPWGLHEVHGNVDEWTADCWHGNYRDAPTDGSAWDKGNRGDCSWRVVRGGGWVDEPGGLRSAFRLGGNPDFAFSSIGFRLARGL